MLSYPSALLDALLGLVGLLLLTAPLLSPRPMRGPVAATLMALGWAGIGRLIVALELPLPSLLTAALGILAGLLVAWQIWRAMADPEAPFNPALALFFLPVLALCLATPVADKHLVDAELLDHPGLLNALLAPSAATETYRASELSPGHPALEPGAAPFLLRDAECGEVVEWVGVGGWEVQRTLTQQRRHAYTRIDDSALFVKGRCEGPMAQRLVSIDPSPFLVSESGVRDAVALYPAPTAEALEGRLNTTRGLHMALPLVVLMFVGVRVGVRG